MIKIGQTVAYSATFLRNIGMRNSNMGKGRGFVLDIQDLKGGLKIASVQWFNHNQWDLPEKVNVQNLRRVK